MLLIQLLKESVLFALSALISNKLRSFLSLLGITIGIFAVISVFTFIDSWEKKIQNSLADLGNNIIYVQKWPWEFSSSFPWWKYMNRPWPKYQEFEILKERATFADAVVFTAGTFNEPIKFRQTTMRNARVLGVTEDYDKVRKFEIGAGRYFSSADFNGGGRVCVIGHNIASELLGNLDPIGQKIRIFGQPVTVIGLFAKEGNNAIDNSLDDIVLSPMNYFRTQVDLKSGSTDPFIMVKAPEGMPTEVLKDELRGIMRSIRRLKPAEEEDFALNQISLIANQVAAFFSVVSSVGFVVGFFSILVGGFGIANIMFVSVRERTSQIGIQKALGAKNYFILIQFLVEAVVLSLFGGILGLILVGTGVLMLNAFMDLGLTLSLGNILFACGISTAIGVISGLVPAITASKMDPVEAIRFV